MALLFLRGRQHMKARWRSSRFFGKSDILDKGITRPCPAQRHHFHHVFNGAGHNDFDGAVPQVPDPAVESEDMGVALNPKAIADALHASRNSETHGISVALGGAHA